MFFFVHALASQTQPARTVHLKVAADFELSTQDTFRSDVRRLVSDACRGFRENFNIIFKTEDFVFWKPEADPPSLKCFLNDLRKKVSKEEKDIVLGLIASSRTEDAAAGLTLYLQGYIILRDLKSRDAMTSLLTHELCHMFGAVDIDEDQSIMDVRSPGRAFDEFTKNIILLNKQRRFDLNARPLPETYLEEAIALYRKRANSNKGEPALHLVLAALLLEKQELDQALVCCQKALALKPGLLDTHILIGNIHLKKGETELALNAFKIALFYQPQVPEIHFNLGLTYTRMGKIEEAIVSYGRAIGLNPLYFNAYANLGYLYLKKKEPDLAIRSSQTALGIVPDSPEVLTNLGAALLLRSRETGPNPMESRKRDEFITRAIERCRHAISLKPHLAQPHNTLGIALAYSGDSQRAEAEFKKACELRPDYMEAYFNLGVLYFQNHHLEKSAEHFARALAIDPGFAQLYQNLAEVYRALFVEYKQEARARGLTDDEALSTDFLFYRKEQDQ